MSKKISNLQIKALKGVINDNMEAEKEQLANTFRDQGEHRIANKIEENATTDDEIAKICKEEGEVDSAWYQYYLLLPLIQ